MIKNTFLDVLEKEKEALNCASKNIDLEEIDKIAKLLMNRNGKLLFVSLGKGGYIADKLAASYSSMGIASFYIHATELFHGDFGRVEDDDIIILLTHSGNTLEVVEAAKELKKRGNKTIAITKSKQSKISKIVDYKICYEIENEADHLNAAPTSSSTVMLAIGDALMVAISKASGYKKEDFHKNHPGGSLGKKLEK